MADEFAVAVAVVVVVLAAAAATWASRSHAGHREEEWAETGDAKVMRRRLCQMERAFQRWASWYHGGNKVAIAVGLQGEHLLRLEDLERAAREMERRHPMVRAVLCEGGFIEAGRDDNHTARPVLRVSQVERENEDSWEAAWQRCESSALKVGEGFFEVVLVAGPAASGSCEVLVVGHHPACDADSLMQLGHELIAAAAGVAERDMSSRPFVPAPTTCVQRDLPSFWRDRLPGYVSYFIWVLYVSMVTRGLNPSRAANPRKVGLLCPTAHHRARLDMETTAKLRASARAHGVTVNAAVMAAVAQAIVDENAKASSVADARKHTVCVNCTVNLRKRYSASKGLSSSDIGNHAVGTYVAGHVQSGATQRAGASALASTAQEMAQELGKLLCEPRRIMPPQLWNWLVFRVIPTNVVVLGSTVAVLGNWGVSPLPAEYAGRAAGRSALSVRFMRPLINFNVFNCSYVATTTTGGCLDVTVIGSRRAFESEQLAALCSRVTANLSLFAAAQAPPR